MDKLFVDLCYEVLSHYAHFPEVADTLKSISDGANIVRTYPTTDREFQEKRFEIITYILKARTDNIIYTYHESRKIFIPSGPGKTIYDDKREELYQQLKSEIQMLVLRGIHQIIKRLYPTVDNDTLSGELLQQNKDTLKKYGLDTDKEGGTYGLA